MDALPELATPLARDLLAAPLVAALATLEPDGSPWLNAMWFLWDGEAALLGTGAATRKVRNLRRDPRAVLMVDDSRAGFDVCGRPFAAPARGTPRDGSRRCRRWCFSRGHRPYCGSRVMPDASPGRRDPPF